MPGNSPSNQSESVIERPPARKSEPAVEQELVRPVPVSRPEASRAAPKLPEKALATDDLNWSQIAHDLKLDAISRQLALNAIVITYQDSHLQLGILPELEVMLKPELEQQIKQAIESRLGVSLKLDFKSLPELKVETPQQAATRLREERRQAVIEQIHQDPVVGQLKQVFGAELIEHSVREQTSKR